MSAITPPVVSNDVRSSSGGGRRVDNHGPILLSPGGTFNMPPDAGLSLNTTVSPTKKNAKSSDSDSPLSKQVPSPDSNQSPDLNYQLIKRDLFGGAISIQIPGSFQDVSTMRDVPDHQEVYVDRDSDMSLIVELLAYDETVSNEQAAAHYYNDLAQCNEAGASSCIECSGIINVEGFMPHLHKASTTRARTQYAKCGVIGRQTVSKYRKRANSAFGEVIVLLCVVRLVDVDTDLLISLNVPIKSSKQPLACQTAPIRPLDPGATSIGRGCGHLLRSSPQGQISLSQPSIAEMFFCKTSRGKGEKYENTKAQTTDLSDAIRAYHRKSEFNASPGKEEGSPVDHSSALGISVENLSLEAPNSGGRKRSVRLSSLEIMRAAMQSIDIHNWSLFA